MKLAFIGLGVMGFPMAGHLARAGHDVTVWNRTSAKTDAWVQTYGGRKAPTARAAAQGADLVFACVGNDDDLRAVVLSSDGAFAGMAAGALFIDHTTASANIARELAQAASARGFGFLDAPVSGGQVGAEKGQLTIMVGGEEGDFARAEPIMAAYARMQKWMGPAGAGQLTKMVNQICIAGVLQGLSEGLALGRAVGLDLGRVIEVISKGAAQSWQMENRGPTMIEGQFNFGFAVDWMRKDLAICLDEARRQGVSLPLAALVDQFYAEVQAMGGHRWDTSSLIKRLERAP